MRKARRYHHPRNSYAEIYGERLEPGDTIRPSDVHDHMDGTWGPAPPILHGKQLPEGANMIIIRPRPVLVLGVCTQSETSSVKG